MKSTMIFGFPFTQTNLHCFLHSLSVNYTICNPIAAAMSSAGLSASERGGSRQAAMS